MLIRLELGERWGLRLTRPSLCVSGIASDPSQSAKVSSGNFTANLRGKTYLLGLKFGAIETYFATKRGTGRAQSRGEPQVPDIFWPFYSAVPEET